MAGRADGEQAARANTSGIAWFLAGFGGGCLGGGIGGLVGVVGAYMWEPVPSFAALIGKSPEYAAAYTDAYKATAKRIQTSNAWTGCIVAGIGWIAFSIYISSVEATTID